MPVCSLHIQLTFGEKNSNGKKFHSPRYDLQYDVCVRSAAPYHPTKGKCHGCAHNKHKPARENNQLERMDGWMIHGWVKWTQIWVGGYRWVGA